ncbi:MAG: UPF0104 family protein [Euryarchaeota archaeon]|nr:UPF0104 family protein [Euryarchaeota archaeon]
MKHKALILLALGIGILVVMILFIGPAKIEDAIKMANLWYVTLAILIQFLLYCLWTYRWSITTNSVGISIKKRYLFPMLMVGMAANNIIPSARGAGEPLRAYILSKYSRTPIEKSFATVIADRGLDIFPFICLAIITIIAMVLYFSLSKWVIYALLLSVMVLLAVFVLAIYMSLNKKFAERVSPWIVKILNRFSRRKRNEIEKRVMKAIGGFQGSLKVMARDRTILGYGVPLSFLIWFIEILRVYIIFSAFNVDVSLIIIAMVFIFASLIGLIPIFPGGIGAIDGLMIVFYSYAGVPPSISAAATIIERLISFWMTTIIGIAILPYFGAEVFDRIFKKL